MQVDKKQYSEDSGRIRLSEKEVVLLAEIGLNQIPTATEFVEYASAAYGMSQSGIWYTLKKLKEKGILSFTEKGDEYRPLALTEGGMKLLRGSMMPVGGVNRDVSGIAQIHA